MPSEPVTLPLLGLRLLQTLLTPGILLLLLLRLLQGKEELRRFPERLGWAGHQRPPGPLIWMHGASVGELTALLPLLRELGAAAAESGLEPPALLVTSVSRSSAQLAQRLLPEGVIHQLAPVDHWLALALFRRHWRPQLGLLAEAELWPELVLAMPRLHLVNARMSERSYRRHRRQPAYAAWLYGRARLCWAQSEPDAARLRRLGATQVEVVGSTKRDADPLAADEAILARLQPLRRRGPVLLLASSHAGEEELLLQARQRLQQQLGPLTLVLVPRHPPRAAAVLELARRQGLVAILWRELAARGPADHADLDVLVVDVLGAMGSWIGASDLVVMGGSLAAGRHRIGGHNPLEAIRAGKPVVCGPDMANFAGLSEELQAAGWLHACPTDELLWARVVELLSRGAPAPPPLRLEGPSRRIAKRLIAELGTADLTDAGLADAHLAREAR
ncbi:3-Deoxy-D-manno-octulosonic-acid transferase family protein [Cyanobium sp. NS01]|nr:3-Deoxy-D-manno-octulosonic-acid transferase family protein [Cyanobium sp. NS01]